MLVDFVQRKKGKILQGKKYAYKGTREKRAILGWEIHEKCKRMEKRSK